MKIDTVLFVSGVSLSVFGTAWGLDATVRESLGGASLAFLIQLLVWKVYILETDGD